MDIITPILDGAALAAASFGDLVTSLLKAIDPGIGWFDDAADGGLGMVLSGLAGVATALLVVILLSVYFRSGYRSARDIVRHSLATALVLSLPRLCGLRHRPRCARLSRAQRIAGRDGNKPAKHGAARRSCRSACPAYPLRQAARDLAACAAG